MSLIKSKYTAIPLCLNLLVFLYVHLLNTLIYDEFLYVLKIGTIAT